MRRAGADAGDLDLVAAITEAITARSPRQAEVPRQRARLDVDRGDDEDAAHAWDEGIPPGGPAATAPAACLRFSQAAYELPAAASRPVNAMLWMSR